MKTPLHLNQYSPAVAATRGTAQAAPGRPQAAGLVSFKTSDPQEFLEISFDYDDVQKRRVKRLRSHVWACGHLHNLGTPKGFRENVWLVTLTYRGVDD